MCMIPKPNWWNATRWLAFLAMVGTSQLAFGQADDSERVFGENRADVARTPSDPRAIAEALNHALAAGEVDVVRALLQEDVLIYESGGAETSAAQYFEHHLSADVAFLSTLNREQLSQTSGGDGTTAWVATRSRLTGQFDGKPVDLDSTETLVLNKKQDRWRIVHIHWSSATH